MPKILAILAAALATSVASPAYADTYPSKPIRMIIAWPVGGYADNLGRYVGNQLAIELKQPVIVENKGGSNGLLGAAVAAKAAPDGYTLMFHSITSHVINPFLYKEVPYGPNDLVPVSVVAGTPLLLVASMSFPAKDMKETLKLARENADKPLGVASFGAGSASHLAIELLKQQANVDLLHVPYRGGGPALVDTVAGNVPLYFAAFGVGQPMVADGKLRALAITSRTRSPMLPDVPTLAQAAALPDFEMSVFYALWAPARTPADIQQRLADALKRIVAAPDFQERLKMEGATGPVTSTPEESRAFAERETQRLGALVKSAKIKLD